MIGVRLSLGDQTKLIFKRDFGDKPHHLQSFGQDVDIHNIEYTIRRVVEEVKLLIMLTLYQQKNGLAKFL